MRGLLIAIIVALTVAYVSSECTEGYVKEGDVCRVDGKQRCGCAPGLKCALPGNSNIPICKKECTEYVKEGQVCRVDGNQVGCGCASGLVCKLPGNSNVPECLKP